jgi:hypothetical protein
MLTRIVSSRIALSISDTWIKPRSSGSIYVTSNPWFSSHAQDLRIALCSIEEVIMCRPLVYNASATPLIIQLSPSVPPDVK